MDAEKDLTCEVEVKPSTKVKKEKVKDVVCKGFSRNEYQVTIKFREPLLGTVAADPNIHLTHVATKMAKGMKKEGYSEDEIKQEIEDTTGAIPPDNIMEQGLTTFYKDEHGYYVQDYQLKGFIKNAAAALKEWGKNKQLRSKVVKYCFVRPRETYLCPPVDLPVVVRPLRASTAQGERICLARSCSIPAGTEISFKIKTLDNCISEDLLRELFSYGEFCGLGANRGSMFGSFDLVSLVKI